MDLLLFRKVITTNFKCVFPIVINKQILYGFGEYTCIIAYRFLYL